LVWGAAVRPPHPPPPTPKTPIPNPQLNDLMIFIILNFKKWQKI